jgi:methyl-accepting chemotaxis protein
MAMFPDHIKGIFQMKFSQFKIGRKLGAAFVAVFLLIAGMAAIGSAWLSKVSGLATEISTVHREKAELASDWYRGTEVNWVRTLAVLRSTDPSLAPIFKPMMEVTSAKISEVQKKLEVLVGSAGGKAILKEIGETRKIYVAARDEAMAAKKSGDEAQAQKLVDQKVLPAVGAYLATIEKLARYQQDLVVNAGKEAADYAASGSRLEIILGLIAIAIGSVLAWLITRSITLPLAEAVEVARAVAGGDLSRHIESHYGGEVGDLMQALADMNDSLLRIVGQVRVSSDQITTASSEIATGNNDLSSRTEQQASNLQQTAASMEQMTSTVQQNADAARQANQLAVTASEIATRGGAEVGRVVTTMDDITQSSKKIADIISVIDGIAFQTNILALNAAVEAARAGEQGRGFAVVASEVRNLAQRSAEAAKEIKTLIGTSVEKVDAGSRLVADAGATMEEIVQSVKRVTDIIGEITAATQEQSTGITQVNQAVMQLDQMTQQNSALVEQSAAAAESLKDQAGKLTEAMSVFKFDASAAKHPVQPVNASPKAQSGSRAEKSAGLKAQVAIVRASAAAGSKPAGSTDAKTATVSARSARPAAVRHSAAAVDPVNPAIAPKVSQKPADDEWEEF